MANIQNDIDAINNAVYGEEVRGSIVNALTLMNNEVGAQQGADAARQQAEAARDAALGYANAAAAYFSVANHRNIYRGISLGDEITSAQEEVIRTGTFDGIFIGDYWETMDGRAYVVDMDYWLGRGTDKHHLIILCDGFNTALANMLVGPMNSSGSVNNGYRSSTIYDVIRSNVNIRRNDVIGEYALDITTRYDDVDSQTGVPNGTTNGSVSVCAELLTETMVFGERVNAISNSGSNAYKSVAPVCPQLSVFKLKQDFLVDLIDGLSEADFATHWSYIAFRDVCTSSSFAGVDRYGNPTTLHANISNQLKLPYFIIGVEEAT